MKKHLLFTFLLILGAIFTSNAQSTHSSILFKHHTTLTTPDVALNSSFHPNISQMGFEEINYAGERGSRRYQEAVHKRNTGIALTAVGGTFLIGGSALLAVGAIGFQNDLNGYNDGTAVLTHTVELVFGTIFALAGTGMTVPGAILLAKGTRDMKKFKAAQAVN